MQQSKETKRIKGPDVAVEPIYDYSVKPTIKRERHNHQLRPLFLKTSTIKQANGSAYFEAGNLKVIAAVYGPRQHLKQKGKSSTKGQLNVDFSYLPFSCTKRRGYPKDTLEKESSLLIQQALVPSIRLDLLPKSQVDVYIQVLESDGNTACLAAAVSCASLALADAGVEMFDVVSACSAGFFESSKILLDCDNLEESRQTGSIFLAYMPSLNKVTHLIQMGEATATSSIKAIELCTDACAEIQTVMAKSLQS